MPSAANRTRRLLDHVVLPVSALSTARARMSQLGFTVAGDASHPFGTENACIFLSDKTYLEPLAIGQRERYEAAAVAGNVFVARDRAYRFRQGEEGFSAIVLSTDDADADDGRFREHGFSAGGMLDFSRAMQLPDGNEAVAAFRLAFAADPQAPDFFCFTCQRIKPLPTDRGALETHANGVTGIRSVVLSEANPSAFQHLLQESLVERKFDVHAFVMDIEAANAKISVLNAAGMSGVFGVETVGDDRGLKGRAIVFSVADLAETQRFFRQAGVSFEMRGGCLLISPAPGQGALLAFGD